MTDERRHAAAQLLEAPTRLRVAHFTRERGYRVHHAKGGPVVPGAIAVDDVYVRRDSAGAGVPSEVLGLNQQMDRHRAVRRCGEMYVAHDGRERLRRRARANGV